MISIGYDMRTRTVWIWFFFGVCMYVQARYALPYRDKTAMESFRPDRSLLNPKFEGYKLDPIPQENAVLRYELQYKPTQSTSLSQSPLSFEEVRSRITHNHLCISSNGERALYVDADYNVIVIDVKVNQVSLIFVIP